IVPDPVDLYFKGLAPGEIPLHFHVAKESLALRSIVGLVDNKEKVKAILDPSSQIITMSEGVCLSLGVTFDPMVRVQMQSANKTVDLTLSLACNVPFQVGSITLYLQRHVVCNPAYDILLGWPFDIDMHRHMMRPAEMRPKARHNHKGNITITITDPNSDLVATILTYPQGKPHFLSGSFHSE
ncbi:hypothetical protein NEOLEDRAFT_1076513, partial [Neolentinus lepideus HHB14362 ss-1]